MSFRPTGMWLHAPGGCTQLFHRSPPKGHNDIELTMHPLLRVQSTPQSTQMTLLGPASHTPCAGQLDYKWHRPRLAPSKPVLQQPIRRLPAGLQQCPPQPLHVQFQPLQTTVLSSWALERRKNSGDRGPLASPTVLGKAYKDPSCQP